MTDGKPTRITHFKQGDSLPDGAKMYRKKTIVALVKMDAPFLCDNREGRQLEGQPGDYIAADGHGGFYPISAEFHAANYVEVSE